MAIAPKDEDWTGLTGLDERFGALDLLSNPVWVLEGEHVRWANAAAVGLAGASSRRDLVRRPLREVVARGPSRLLALGVSLDPGHKERQRWTFVSPAGPCLVDCDIGCVLLDEDRPAILAEGRVALGDRADLIATQRALADAKRLLSAVLNDSPVGLAILDATRMVRLANKAFGEIFGCGSADVIGTSIGTVFAAKDEFAALCSRLDAVVAEGGTFYDEMRLSRLDGVPIWCSLSARMVDASELAQGVVWAFADISARVESQAALAEAHARLERQTAELARSNEDLEQFAYVVSHDLRQPLRQVSSYLSLIGRGVTEDEEADARQFVGFALDGARRMDRLIVDLLDYSRIGRMARPSERVPLDEVMAEVLDILDVTIKESQAEVSVAKDLPVVSGDPGELARLFQNLIGNALKYAKPDCPPQVSVTVRRDQGADIIAVADNGIGIDPAQFERIFKIFQRLHARGSYEGTGIGLAICRKIVERMGGGLWVDSTPGQGSTFFVRLPLAGDL